MKTLAVFFICLILYLLSPSPTLASSSLSSTHYIYDSVGNIQKIEDKVDGSKTENFSYDGIYRLEKAQGGYKADYVYDQDGNILTKNEAESLNIGYNSSQPLHAPKSVNGKTLTYDSNGNLISDDYSNLKIAYDYEGRPIQIQHTTQNLQLITKYYYDGEGKRVKKESFENGNLKTTTYYINQYFEKEVPNGGSPKVRKFYAGIAYREADTLNYITSDHLSSTTLLTNSQGQKTSDYRYYPYGSPILPAGTSNEGGPPNSWIGQKLDTESGLYFLNARYYSPVTGRFIQKDIINDPKAGGNGYLYAGNNPIVGRDSNGAFCDYGEFCLGDIAGVVWSGITDTAGRMSIDAQYYLNNHSTPGKQPENIAALVDFATLGQASRTVESWSRNWPTLSNGDLTIGERLPAAIDTGMNITAFTAAVVPAGKFSTQTNIYKGDDDWTRLLKVPEKQWNNRQILVNGTQTLVWKTWAAKIEIDIVRKANGRFGLPKFYGTKGQGYMMEYIKGTTLFEFQLQGGVLSEAQRLAINQNIQRVQKLTNLHMVDINGGDLIIQPDGTTRWIDPIGFTPEVWNEIGGY